MKNYNICCASHTKKIIKKKNGKGKTGAGLIKEEKGKEKK